MSAGLASKLGIQPIAGENGNASAANIFTNLAGSMAGNIVDSAARSVIDGSDFGDNLLAALPNTIAQTVMDVAMRHAMKGGVDYNKPHAMIEPSTPEDEVANASYDLQQKSNAKVTELLDSEPVKRLEPQLAELGVTIERPDNGPPVMKVPAGTQAFTVTDKQSGMMISFDSIVKRPDGFFEIRTTDKSMDGKTTIGKDQGSIFMLADSDQQQPAFSIAFGPANGAATRLIINASGGMAFYTSGDAVFPWMGLQVRSGFFPEFYRDSFTASLASIYGDSTFYEKFRPSLFASTPSILIDTPEAKRGRLTAQSASVDTFFDRLLSNLGKIPGQMLSGAVQSGVDEQRQFQEISNIMYSNFTGDSKSADESFTKLEQIEKKQVTSVQASVDFVKNTADNASRGDPTALADVTTAAVVVVATRKVAKLTGGKKLPPPRPTLGVLADARFAQVPAKGTKAFSPVGQAKYSQASGRQIRTVDDLAQALRDGVITPKQVPIDYVIVNGVPVITNTRSSQALLNAGIPKAEWYGVNQTGRVKYGNVTFDQDVMNQLRSNYKGNVSNARQ